MRLPLAASAQTQVRPTSLALTRSATILTVALAAAFTVPPLAAQQRPLTFMDVQEMRRAGSWTPSPDGAWMLVG